MLLKFHRDILRHHLAAITATAVVVVAAATATSVEEWVPPNSNSNSLQLLDKDDEDDRVGIIPFNGNNNVTEEKEKEPTTTNVNHDDLSYNNKNQLRNQNKKEDNNKNDTTLTTTTTVSMSVVDLGKLSTSRRELRRKKCENKPNYLFKGQGTYIYVSFFVHIRSFIFRPCCIRVQVVFWSGLFRIALFSSLLLLLMLFLCSISFLYSNQSFVLYLVPVIVIFVVSNFDISYSFVLLRLRLPTSLYIPPSTTLPAYLFLSACLPLSFYLPTSSFPLFYQRLLSYCNE